MSDKKKVVAKKTPAKAVSKKRAPSKRLPDSKKTKRPQGRPEVWTKEYCSEIADLLFAYTEKTDYPSIADFCFKNNIRKQRLYEQPELEAERERLLAKKEACLEKLGRSLTKEQGSRGSFIIFALKQLGWKDKQEISGPDGAPLNFTVEFVKAGHADKN